MNMRVVVGGGGCCFCCVVLLFAFRHVLTSRVAVNTMTPRDAQNGTQKTIDAANTLTPRDAQNGTLKTIKYLIFNVLHVKHWPNTFPLCGRYRIQSQFEEIRQSNIVSDISGQCGQPTNDDECPNLDAIMIQEGFTALYEKLMSNRTFKGGWAIRTSWDKAPVGFSKNGGSVAVMWKTKTLGADVGALYAFDLEGKTASAEGKPQEGSKEAVFVDLALDGQPVRLGSIWAPAGGGDVHKVPKVGPEGTKKILDACKPEEVSNPKPTGMFAGAYVLSNDAREACTKGSLGWQEESGKKTDASLNWCPPGYAQRVFGLKRVTEFLAKLDGDVPTIVGGDFNDFKISDTVKQATDQVGMGEFWDLAKCEGDCTKNGQYPFNVNNKAQPMTKDAQNLKCPSAVVSKENMGTCNGKPILIDNVLFTKQWVSTYRPAILPHVPVQAKLQNEEDPGGEECHGQAPQEVEYAIAGFKPAEGGALPVPVKEAAVDVSRGDRNMKNRLSSLKNEMEALGWKDFAGDHTAFVGTATLSVESLPHKAIKYLIFNVLHVKHWPNTFPLCGRYRIQSQFEEIRQSNIVNDISEQCGQPTKDDECPNLDAIMIQEGFVALYKKLMSNRNFKGGWAIRTSWDRAPVGFPKNGGSVAVMWKTKTLGADVGAVYAFDLEGKTAFAEGKPQEGSKEAVFVDLALDGQPVRLGSIWAPAGGGDVHKVPKVGPEGTKKILDACKPEEVSNPKPPGMFAGAYGLSKDAREACTKGSLGWQEESGKITDASLNWCPPGYAQRVFGLKRVTEFLAKLDGDVPTIVGGDFNDYKISDTVKQATDQAGMGEFWDLAKCEGDCTKNGQYPFNVNNKAQPMSTAAQNFKCPSAVVSKENMGTCNGKPILIDNVLFTKHWNSTYRPAILPHVPSQAKLQNEEDPGGEECHGQAPQEVEYAIAGFEPAKGDSLPVPVKEAKFDVSLQKRRNENRLASLKNEMEALGWEGFAGDHTAFVGTASLKIQAQ